MQIIRTTILLFLIISAPLMGKVRGKIDGGALFISLKQKSLGMENKRLDMGGVRIDATVLPFEGYGFGFKSSATAVTGDAEFYLWNIGVGHYTPITDCFSVFPIVGYGFNLLDDARINILVPTQIGPVEIRKAKEHICSHSVFMGTDFVYKFSDCLYSTIAVQYAFARSHTRITQGTPALPKAIRLKGGTQGWNLGLLIDYLINDCFSVNLGVGYNSSLDREKFGIQGYGVKLGAGYWF